MILHLHLRSRTGELAARSHPASAALIWHSCYRFWWVTSCLSPLCILWRPIYLIRISTMISWDISAWWEDVPSGGIHNNWSNMRSPKTLTGAQGIEDDWRHSMVKPGSVYTPCTLWMCFTLNYLCSMCCWMMCAHALCEQSYYCMSSCLDIQWFIILSPPCPSRTNEWIQSWKTIGQVQHHDCSPHAHSNLSLHHISTYHNDKTSFLALGNSLRRTPSHVSAWPHITSALSQPLLLPLGQGKAWICPIITAHESLFPHCRCCCEDDASYETLPEPLVAQVRVGDWDVFSLL